VAVLTAVVERLEIQMEDTPPYQGKFARAIVDVQLRRFYYDAAKVANVVTIGALAKLVPISPIVFGTGYPYRSGAEYMRGLAANFGADDLKAIDRENALRILPRLRTA
jgi:predicted TIM-barrel fold metal-dependent hydrolase